MRIASTSLEHVRNEIIRYMLFALRLIFHSSLASLSVPSKSEMTYSKNSAGWIIERDTTSKPQSTSVESWLLSTRMRPEKRFLPRVGSSIPQDLWFPRPRHCSEMNGAFLELILDDSTPERTRTRLLRLSSSWTNPEKNLLSLSLVYILRKAKLKWPFLLPPEIPRITRSRNRDATFAQVKKWESSVSWLKFRLLRLFRLFRLERRKWIK